MRSWSVSKSSGMATTILYAMPEMHGGMKRVKMHPFGFWNETLEQGFLENESQRSRALWWKEVLARIQGTTLSQKAQARGAMTRGGLRHRTFEIMMTCPRLVSF